MKKDTLEKIGLVSLLTTGFVGVVGLLVLSPVITFGFAYLGGLILQIFVGDSIVNGLNILFDTTRFQAQYIPVLCATLATIGKYFKSTQTNNNKEK